MVPASMLDFNEADGVRDSMLMCDRSDLLVTQLHAIFTGFHGHIHGQSLARCEHG